MNEHDSARMGESLLRAGWVPAEAAENADLVLLNTCAIREKAEDKLYSALGRYRMVKAQRGARIGVAGCVAQQEKDGLLERAPYVDFVLGPDQIARVAELAEQGGVETGWVPSEEYVFPQADPETARGKATAFVTAMKGCDNVCSFCVVPHTRGREVSRPYGEIVPAVPDLRRIRFTTSHPMDLSPELVDCFREVDKLMPHFHLPVQHGADTVLERMRRRYTVAQYEDRVAGLLAACPEVALTSDIICGFPGETEEEHARTLALLRRVRYDKLYSFVFSERPHTAAALRLSRERTAGQRSPEWLEVPRLVATRRLEEVQRLQQERTLERHRSRIGGQVEVLVESARTEPGVPGERFGRSRENWTVHFAGASAVGDLVRVRVERAGLVALVGAEVAVTDATRHPAPPGPQIG